MKRMRAILQGFGYLALVFLPLLSALPLVQTQAGKAAEEEASTLALRALRRNEEVTDQVFAAIGQMESKSWSDPCATTSIREMTEIALAYHHIQALAIVQNDQIVCSSLGSQALDGLMLGKPDVVSRRGLAVRAVRQLPVSLSGEPYRISTMEKSGYTVLVHQNSAFDGTDPQSRISTGIVGTVSATPITVGQVWKKHWAERRNGEQPTAFLDGEWVVAIHPSQRYAYFAYAAIPASTITEHAQRTNKIVWPLTLLLGVLAATALHLLLRRRWGLLGQLERALASKHQLHVVYQPIVNLADGTWSGAEALLRWRHPDGNMISPAIFIPFAEEHGLITQVTRKMLSIVLNDLSTAAHLPTDFYISVNFSGLDLADMSLIESLSAEIDSLSIPRQCVRIEVTEHSVLDQQSVAEAIEQLRQSGIKVAIDDFGTGYSSLSYLNQLNVDVLKIDKSFVDTIGKNTVSSGVIPHIIRMAHELDLSIIAEGIEQDSQRDYLLAHSVQYGQGWLFAKPMSFSQLAQGLNIPQESAIN